MIDWPRLVELIHTHDRFVLTTHHRPDGDALGSQLAMAAVLEALGKQVLLLNGFSVPRHMAFIDPGHKCKQVNVDVPAAVLDQYQVLLVLDTSAWAQLGPMADVIRNAKIKKAVLDHHASADDLGAEMFRWEQAEATGRLVLDLADRLGVALTPEIAVPAFIAVATDTGWFRFGSATADVFRFGARLVEAGVRPDHVYRDLYENESIGRLRLMGRAMGRTVTEREGRLIYTWLTLDDFQSADALPSDSEDIINTTLSVTGTQVAVIFVEQPSGGFKLSFRSRCDFDCARLAEQFGGGGHKKAAGASLTGDLETVRARALDAVRAAMG